MEVNRQALETTINIGPSCESSNVSPALSTVPPLASSRANLPELLVKTLFEASVDIDLVAGTYELHLEVINTLLALLSSQMYGPLSPEYRNPFLPLLFSSKLCANRAGELIQTLLNFIAMGDNHGKPCHLPPETEQPEVLSHSTDLLAPRSLLPQNDDSLSSGSAGLADSAIINRIRAISISSVQEVGRKLLLLPISVYRFVFENAPQF